MQAGQATTAVEALEAAAAAGNIEAECFLGAIVNAPNAYATHAITGVLCVSSALHLFVRPVLGALCSSHLHLKSPMIQTTTGTGQPFRILCHVRKSGTLYDLSLPVYNRT
jgi:hypothetical protein